MNAARQFSLRAQGCILPRTQQFSTANVHYFDEVHNLGHLPDGTKATANNTGFEMNTQSPLFAAWVASYNGEQPLLDIGCAYGLNSIAALDFLQGERTKERSEENKTLVIASDNDNFHLEMVEKLGRSGLITSFASFPQSLPDVKGFGGVSGILMSEVLQCLPGHVIDESLRACYDMLVPGGLLVITTVSPRIGARVYREYSANSKMGKSWPGEGLDVHANGALQSELQSKKLEIFLPYFQSFWNFIGRKEATRACTEAGFAVLKSSYGRHPGYKSLISEDRAHNSNLQVLAVKPIS